MFPLLPIWLRARIRVVLFSDEYDWAISWNTANSHIGGAGSSPGKSEEDIERAVVFIKRAMDIKPQDRILDIGCGDGTFAKRFGCDVLGVDFPEVVKRAIIPAV